MRILLALVALCRWKDLLAQELTTVTTQQSKAVKENLNIADKRLEFVNIIRDDLRRNNDDYALLDRQNQLAYPAPPAHRPHPAPPASRPPYRKRLLPPGPRPQPPRQYYGDTRRGEGDLNQSFHDDSVRSYTHSKHYKSVRMNKLKRLLNKDKIQMREAEQNEEDTPIKTLPETKLSASPPAPPPPPPPPPPLPPPPPARSPPSRTPEPRPRFTPQRQRRDSPPPVDTEQQVPALRQRKKKSQSPSPDQLDMAAARNSEIARIRSKGRLCQRSFMNMEGPTYDKLGKTVFPKFRTRKAHGRKFQQTRAPELVLPRCCNCCKKSVLGCQ